MEKFRPKELSYFYHDHKIIEWLKSSPPDTDVSYNERQKKFQKYSVIKRKLDTLCPDTWDSKNFHQFIFYMPDKRIKVSGNIDVAIRYHYLLEDKSGVREVNRTLAGAATFFAADYAPNEHWAATLKSLCIVNAVQALGKQFGEGLNPEEDDQDVYTVVVPTEKSRNGIAASKMTPDPLMRQKYAKAIVEGNVSVIADMEAMYDFKILV